jgi:N-ethylmaleimide reductase
MIERLRGAYDGVYVANGGMDADAAASAVAAGEVDAVAWGRAFLANPDLPERFRRGAALNEPDRATFYGGGAKGYVDYPALDDERAA